MKDGKAEMCTSSSDLVLKLGHNYIYINKSAAIKLKRLSFLYNHYLSKLEEGLVK